MALKGPEHISGGRWLLVTPRAAVSDTWVISTQTQTQILQNLHQILVVGSGVAPLAPKCLQSPGSFFQMVQLQEKYNQKAIWNQLTFKLHDFSVLGFWEPFQTHFSGESQSNPTAPQQEANLLPTSILREEGKKITPVQR